MSFVAEGERFELSREFYLPSDLANRRNRPLCGPSKYLEFMRISWDRQVLHDFIFYLTLISIIRVMKIKDLPKVDRPREKLEKYGPDRLSNSELLAILLGTGTKGVNVVELSNKILKKFSGDGLAKASFKELKNTFGLGSAKACEIIACFELSKRLLKG